MQPYKLESHVKTMSTSKTVILATFHTDAYQSGQPVYQNILIHGLVINVMLKSTKILIVYHIIYQNIKLVTIPLPFPLGIYFSRQDLGCVLSIQSSYRLRPHRRSQSHYHRYY